MKIRENKRTLKIEKNKRMKEQNNKCGYCQCVGCSPEAVD